MAQPVTNPANNPAQAVVDAVTQADINQLASMAFLASLVVAFAFGFLAGRLR